MAHDQPVRAVLDGLAFFQCLSREQDLFDLLLACARLGRHEGQDHGCCCDEEESGGDWHLCCWAGRCESARDSTTL